ITHPDCPTQEVYPQMLCWPVASGHPHLASKKPVLPEPGNAAPLRPFLAQNLHTDFGLALPRTPRHAKRYASPSRSAGRPALQTKPLLTLQPPVPTMRGTAFS